MQGITYQIVANLLSPFALLQPPCHDVETGTDEQVFSVKPRARCTCPNSSCAAHFYRKLIHKFQ
jgi:hypothetical protein